jgi:hypothetical protein
VETAEGLLWLQKFVEMKRAWTILRSKQQKPFLKCKQLDDVGVSAGEKRIVAEIDVEKDALRFTLWNKEFRIKPEEIAQLLNLLLHNLLGKLKVVLEPDKHIIVIIGIHKTKN